MQVFDKSFTEEAGHLKIITQDFFRQLRGHLSITSSKRWVGGVRKWQFLMIYSTVQESRREGWTDARSAVGFCLGSGLFGSYNSD